MNYRLTTPRHDHRAPTRVLFLLLLACAGPLTGCGDDSKDKADASAGDGDQGGDGDGACPTPDQVTTLLPESLACTGLYSDLGDKTIGEDVQEFEPAYKLWSDGAEKTRWILLPKGSKIDGSDPDDWKFPAQTRLFKQFNWKGHRVETRVFWKVRDGFWLKAAYHWNEDETEATRFAGGEVDVAGDTYEIPTAKMCDQCHKGRTDRSLGFEPVLLGLDGAKGITLKSLVDDGVLENYDGPTELEIGDDGTGEGAEALGWMHVNCGVSCHNRFPASEAFKTDLSMRLQAAELDGSHTGGLDAHSTNIDVLASTQRWEGQTRVIPGNAEDSLLYYLVTTRNDAKKKDRMPPIGSRVVPEEGATLLKRWIEALGTPPDPDEDAGI